MTDPARVPHALFKILLGLAVGLLVAFITPATWPWVARVLLGWVAFCATVLLRLWSWMWRATPEQTRKLALREDETRAVADTVVLVAALVSLVGVGFTLHVANAKETTDLAALGLTGLAVLTVAASWLLVHSEYVLHYARRFYTDGGGVTFPEGDSGSLEAPDFKDFAYLAFVLGMTFQVSDTNITTRTMRRAVLGHSLLSYVFGTVIVAVTINGVAGIIGAGG